MTKKILKTFAMLSMVFILAAFLASCSHPTEGTPSQPWDNAVEESANPSNGNSGKSTIKNTNENVNEKTPDEEASNMNIDESIANITETAQQLYDETMEELGLGNSEASQPHHAIGEEVQVTDNLAVKVISVEAGPYDHADDTDTVKVTVEMRNLTDRVLHVKASNWNADNANGQRVDHKYFVFNESNEKVASSFTTAAISPNATFSGELYFDGKALVHVLYEPHWIVSPESSYIVFDVLGA